IRQVEIWRALGKASKALRFGFDVKIGAAPSTPSAPALSARSPSAPAPSAPLMARLLRRAEDDGLLELALWVADGSASRTIEDAIRAHGQVPLPPYIKRALAPEDAERYQTVFARVEGAVAAPTAGLHITRALLGRLAVRGCELATVTLHVGLGTFQP